MAPNTTMITEQVLVEARKLWDYHHMHHTPAPSDCILVLGSVDLRVADRGAELYLQGLAPFIIFSGGLGNITRQKWSEPEADQMARIALDRGVPSEAIFIENKSANTDCHEIQNVGADPRVCPGTPKYKGRHIGLPLH